MAAPKIGGSVKDVLWTAQNRECWICKRPMLRKGSNDPASASLDHIWPKACYGEIGDVGVTLLACRGCNGRRGSPKPSDAEVRKLVTICRKVDRRWLRLIVQTAESDLKTLHVQRARVELLRMLEAA